MLYGTTREFLEFFNLRDLKDLPTLREFHELSEEHHAQVAALEGVAPEGSIERKARRRAAAAEAARRRSRASRSPRRPRTSSELEEIDRLSAPPASPPTWISRPTAVAGDGEAATPDEFEHQPTREFEAVAGEPTRIHANTIPTPEIVDDEFDHSETTEQEAAPRRARATHARRRRRCQDGDDDSRRRIRSDLAMAEMRLQRFLAQAGVASRRKAEELITAGRVKVNGQVVSELGSKVDPDIDKVSLGGQAAARRARRLPDAQQAPRLRHHDVGSRRAPDGAQLLAAAPARASTPSAASTSTPRACSSAPTTATWRTRSCTPSTRCARPTTSSSRAWPRRTSSRSWRHGVTLDDGDAHRARRGGAARAHTGKNTLDRGQPSTRARTGRSTASPRRSASTCSS